MSSEDFDERQQIARTILEQLGGSQGKLRARIGARDFLVLEAGVSFRYMRTDSGMNTVRIELVNDLYNMEFGSITGGLPDLDDLDVFDVNDEDEVAAALADWEPSVAEYQARERFDGIFADQLRPIFEETTGLRLVIFGRKP